jgi:hypothetical protein
VRIFLKQIYLEKPLSKLDKILYFFIFLRKRSNLLVLINRINNTFIDTFNVVSLQKNIITRILQFSFYWMPFVPWYIFVLISYLIIYTIVSLLTTFIVVLITLPLGIFYGFFPFLLRTTYLNKDDESKVKEFKGYRKLLLPLLWSVSLFSLSGKFFQKTAFAPMNKLFELRFEKESQIILSIALYISLMISVPLYTMVMWLIGNFVVSILVAIFGLIPLFLFMAIDLFQQKTNEDINEE